MEKTKDNIFSSVYTRKDFGLGLVFLGCIFLINPMYGAIDIIPDFIGLLMIYSGLVKFADLDARLEQSRKSFFASMWVGVGMAIGMLLLLFFSFDRDTSLTITFSGEILWTIFLIIAFNNLFEGMSYLKLRSKEDETESDIKEIKVFTIVFLAIRAVLTVVPEATSLLKDNENLSLTPSSNIDIIKIGITVLSMVIVLVVGILWLLRMRKYISSLKDDDLFIMYLHNRYDEEIGKDTHLLNRRKIRIFSILCICAYVFTICVPVDGLHLIPEFVFGIILYFAFRQAKDYLTLEKKYLNQTLIFFLVSSVFMYVMRMVYSYFYAYSIAPFDPKAENPIRFWIIYALVIISSFLNFFFMYKLANITYVIRDSMIEKCVGLKVTDSEYRRELDNARKKELRTKSKVVYILQMIYAFASIICMALVPFKDVLVAFGIYWAYRLLLCIIAIVGIYVIGADLNDEAEKMV